MPLGVIGQLFRFARDTQDLYKLQQTMKETIVALADRLRSVEDRLEAQQSQVITEAKAAATDAATLIAGAVISGAVTRVTRPEDGIRRLEHPTPLLQGRSVDC